MDEEIRAKWERFLNPEILRTNIIIGSVYIAAFEILKCSIIERIKDFYTTGFDENGWIVQPEYKNNVLSKDKSPTYASLKWLRASNAIDNDDIGKFDKAKDFRNILAHEFAKILTEGFPEDFSDRFNDMVTLLNKIEKWWIINVEIPTDPHLNDENGEVDESGIIPGTIMNLRLMIDLALGSDETANYYIKEFKKRLDKR
jgi:hypothetical protein